jgi:hypothetical protein
VLTASREVFITSEEEDVDPGNTSAKLPSDLGTKTRRVIFSQDSACGVRPIGVFLGHFAGAQPCASLNVQE